MSYFLIFVAFTLRPLKHSSVKPKVQNVKTQMLARALVRSLSTVHKNSAYSVGENFGLYPNRPHEEGQICHFHS